MDQRPGQGLFLPLTWWPLCLAECRSLWWKLSWCWRSTDQTTGKAAGEVLTSCRSVTVTGSYCCVWERTHAWLNLLLFYIYIYINLESRKNNFHAHLISSELRKDLDVPEFFPFFPQTGANHFPLACCLRFMGYLRSVCAWKFVTHQNTRLQNCSPCLIFNFILCILSITEFPKDRISQVVKRHTSASRCS